MVDPVDGEAGAPYLVCQSCIALPKVWECNSCMRAGVKLGEAERDVGALHCHPSAAGAAVAAGTTNFVHRFPFSCVSIGLTVGRRVVAGVWRLALQC